MVRLSDAELARLDELRRPTYTERRSFARSSGSRRAATRSPPAPKRSASSPAWPAMDGPPPRSRSSGRSATTGPRPRASWRGCSAMSEHCEHGFAEGRRCRCGGPDAGKEPKRRSGVRGRRASRCDEEWRAEELRSMGLIGWRPLGEFLRGRRLSPRSTGSRASSRCSATTLGAVPARDRRPSAPPPDAKPVLIPRGNGKSDAPRGARGLWSCSNFADAQIVVGAASGSRPAVRHRPRDGATPSQRWSRSPAVRSGRRQGWIKVIAADGRSSTA